MNKQWQAGHKAFFDGASQSDNPYKPNTKRYLEWEDGYLTAKAEVSC